MAKDLKNFSNGLEEEMTEHQFKIGVWFTTHRPQLYEALILFILVFDILLGGYNLYKWGDYLFFGYTADQKLATEIAQPLSNTSVLHNFLSPKSLVAEGTAVFFNANKVDAVTWLKNPNAKYSVSFSYDFVLGGVRTTSNQAFLLPEEEKPIAQLGIKADGAGSANVEIKNVAWQRIDAHKIKNIPAFMAERINFNASDFKLTPSYSLGLPQNRISFKISNDTFFSYWQADFWVILKSGETPVGIERLALDNFAGGDKRDVQLIIPVSVNPNNVQLFPDINVFDPKVFLK